MAIRRTTVSNGKTTRADHVADDRKARVPIRGEDIARRAFELYCERGGQHGHDVEDWLQAERELRDRAGSLSNVARR
jgi:hypothetical protein